MEEIPLGADRTQPKLLEALPVRVIFFRACEAYEAHLTMPSWTRYSMAMRVPPP